MLTTSKGLTVDQLNNRVCIAKDLAKRLRSVLEEIDAEVSTPTEDLYCDDINERQVMSALNDLQWLELSLSCLNFEDVKLC